MLRHAVFYTTYGWGKPQPFYAALKETRMKVIKKEALDMILSSITDDTKLSNQLVPWNWLGDTAETIANSFGHSLTRETMTGYCQPFAKPVTVEGSDDLYWLYFVAFYSKRSNPVVESTGIQYGLFIEGETEHFYAALTGWEAGRHHGINVCDASVTTGVVDYDGRVIFAHYPHIRRRMEWLSRTLMERELRRGDAYLACYAAHLHNELYTSADRPLTIGSMIIPTYRTLSDIAEGK